MSSLLDIPGFDTPSFELGEHVTPRAPDTPATATANATTTKRFMAGSAVPTDAEARYFTVEVSPAHLVLAEILTVTSAMRKNQRWASAPLSTYGYHPTASSSSFSSTIASTSAPGTSLATAVGNNALPINVLKHKTSSGASTPPAATSTGLGPSIPSRSVSATMRSASTDSRLGKSPASTAASSLMTAFGVLKLELRACADVSQLDAVTLLSPFLDVVRSPETSGPITATALASIDKFISYSVLHPDSPNLASAMAQLSNAATHCKFEASDSVSDEIVLLKILDVLRIGLTGPLGGVLSDESVCEMIETGLSMCCQMRLSEMLRRSAERTMQAMIASVFSRLRTFPPEEDEFSTDFPYSNDPSRAPTPMPPPPREGSLEASMASTADPSGMNSIPLTAPSSIVDGDHSTLVEEDALSTISTEEEPLPFGLPSLQEVMRVLVSLLNPHDQQHTDSMRLMALGLLNIAFEVGGRSISRFPSLRAMVGDHLCKHLFQLARSDNLLLLSTSLRVITNIFDTMREQLKLQQELFLSFLLDRLVIAPSGVAPGTRKGEIEAQLDALTWANETPLEIDPRTGAVIMNGLGSRDRDGKDSRDRDRGGQGNGGGTGHGYGMPTEARELMLEILGQFARGPYAMVDLWVNYDCAVEGEDLFERMIRFLARGVFPSHQQPTSGSGSAQDYYQLSSLDTLLEFVSHMASRQGDDHSPDAPTSSSTTLSASTVASTKANKQLLLEGAAQFNHKPKVGIQFLEEHGVIYSDANTTREESIAKFFKTTPRLDKKLLGDFISRGEQIEVLRAFMKLLDFKGKIICDAMRELLECFRLPGESQQIARITETFAEVYFATGPADIKTQDAVYVLAYSVIMLNTDLHNPQVRKRMDIVAYSRNLRGVNDGKDFAPEYLKSIYDSIRKREIILPEEHQNQAGFEYGWKELLRRTRQSGPFVHIYTNAFDQQIFKLVWKPIVSALTFAFADFKDDYMIQRTIEGFNECASLAAEFDMPEVFDFLVNSLGRVTGLANTPTSPDLGSFPVVDVEPGQSVVVSPLAVRFGKNVKAQLAAVVLFTIANQNGAASIREGWTQIFEILQALFVHSLLPPPLLAMEDFLSGGSVIPLKPTSAPVPREDRRSDGGLLSTLSSYLLSPYGSNDVPGNDYTEDDVETTLSAVDCIASCQIEQLYSQIFELQGPALVAPVQVLVELCQRLTIDRLRTRTGSATTNQSPQISLPTARVQLPYDPSAVFLLEIATSIASRSTESIAGLWPIMFDFMSKLLSAANSFSSLFNERVVAALLRLCAVVVAEDELRDSTFLAIDMLRSLSPAVLASVAESLMVGLARLFHESADRIHSKTEWNLIFALFSATLQHEAAAKISFELMQKLAAGKKDDKAKLGPNNYASFLVVLVAFANVNVASTTTSMATTSSGNMRMPPRSTTAAIEADRGMEDPAAQRAGQIVDILKSTQEALPSLIAESNLSATRAWEASWIPLLSAYAQLCLNPSRELRQIAISSLQRTLVAREILDNPNVDFTTIFERVFFPMLEELLKPQVFRRDPEGMGETRLRASALLCKIFLSYLTQLSERQGMETMTQLWLRILGYQDRFMHSGRRDQMYEAVPESLKNVLLVMNEAGSLRPPHDPKRTPEHAPLWDATFERIEPFLPGLKNELFPPPKAPLPFSNLVPGGGGGGVGGSVPLVPPQMSQSPPHTQQPPPPPPRMTTPPRPAGHSNEYHQQVHGRSPASMESVVVSML
ncbi:BQ5605_C003g01849 [Microbotryum silenes-dioicae]|uniref:BQ5605_C003g01849 protein n=1 Tax=Microbotryum silenes-dioicae TaxID=796604 RepID=A0A2X0MUP9_9BASI|nr:BQ5605_C003g01849 [Microbotryum silenes-dioicae]